MQDDTKNNADASGTTPPLKPARDKLSEAEQLAGEAADAKGAIAHTLGEMRASLKEAADVRAWARSYPWTTLGAAAATGFLVAAALFPKRGRREKEDAALQERILTDEQIAARLRELAAEDAKRPGEGPMHAIISALLTTFGPAVQSAVTAAIMPRPPQDAAPNGHPDGSPAANDPTQPPPSSSE
jgi:ElaB/YqjD/DUF883 family membrane-anchored ribosome-binding protein